MGLSSLQSERIQRRRIGEGLELTFLLPSLFPSLSLAFSRSSAPFASVEDNQDQYQDGGWVNSPIKLSFTCSLRVASLTSSAPSSFAVRLPILQLKTRYILQQLRERDQQPPPLNQAVVVPQVASPLDLLLSQRLRQRLSYLSVLFRS